MKICSHCKVPKDESEFNFRNKSKNIKQHYCKECGKQFTAAHYKRNPLPYKQRARKREKVGKRQVFEYLQTHFCVDCGESDPIVLQFDHVHGKKFKEISVMANMGYSWISLKKEIDKCEVRCANCHIRITSKRMNSFRYKHSI